MINLISSGEIQKGMWIVAYEAQYQQMINNQMTGELEMKQLPMIQPWFKGIPYLVTGIAGPIVSVKTFGLQGMPQIIFYDTRLVKFMEVDKEFGENYIKEMIPAKIEENIAPQLGGLSTVTTLKIG